MKIHIKGYEDSKQGRHTLYNGWDKKNELQELPINKIGDKLNEIYDKDFGEVEFIEIKIRHKLNTSLVEQDKRYIKAVGVDLEKRLLLSFGQVFLITQFVTLYLALTGTIQNYYNIIHGDNIWSIIGLFLVNGIVFGMIFSFGISNMIFLIRYMVFQYNEKKRVEHRNE